MYVIQCGYSIKCQNEIPEELYQHLGTNTSTVESPFATCAGGRVQEVFKQGIEAANSNAASFEDVKAAIKAITITEKGETPNDDKEFVRSFLSFL
ncbi:hypothetical protein V8B55DRAFT_1437683 [Mucor lusitanicus]|uniref:Uncharacterized protein n=2 Tax=Mucor circinelloides f. lusitanicus TaxID=29924 RepID=A0A168LB87_MUCCL|nr:hypothetical protein FB192DRAFT_1461434 [Mucor lusitanicus]OAD03324.1 hypothetical protein MUCCIDRAFT_110182 [Mucor lusitanicus CBS 277.49]